MASKREGDFKQLTAGEVLRRLTLEQEKKEKLRMEEEGFQTNKALQELEAKAYSLRQCADAMDNYAKTIKKNESPIGMRVTRADRMGWAINELENLVRNFNFASMARIMGELKACEPRPLCITLQNAKDQKP